MDTAEEIEIFEEWVDANPYMMGEIERNACIMQERVGMVSAKFLIEHERYLSNLKRKPVKYVGRDGKMHKYALWNAASPLLARWLKSRHPDLKFKTCKSKFDGVYDA